jgi:hypothetical protein
MGQDKGKARKSLSADKRTDRIADILLLSGDNAMQGVANALQYRSYKTNISRETKQSYKDAAASANKSADQWRSKQAQAIIDDTQGGPKMTLKGYGN